MNHQQQVLRTQFSPIAVVEHHHLQDPVLSIYDICDRLGQLWLDIKTETQTGAFTLDIACLLALHGRIAAQFDSSPGTFRDRERWQNLVQEEENLDDDPEHLFSWLFSALYWNHLTCFRLATTWFFVNALRVQKGYPEYLLSLDKLGPFLVSLSGSGPPLYDGQTFYPDQYANKSFI